MASWKTELLVKMLTLYNYLSLLFNKTKDKVTDFYYYIKDYIYGHHDMWLFIPGHTFPLSLSNLNNMIHVNWIYDNFDNSLTFGTNGNVLVHHCKLSWLSAKIRIITDSDSVHALEYEIDDFIEKFTFHTIDNVVPSLYMIFLCWCAYTKHWFKANDTVQFHIINDMGDDIVLTIEEHNNSLVIKHNKLCLKVDSDEEESESKEPESDETTPLVQEEKKKDD
jgi:hypothetical protein